MQQKPNQRVVYLDLLRVVATFGVIVLHAYSFGTDSQLYSPTWYYSVVFDSLVRWSVPVFFMISGALFLNPIKAITINTIVLKSIPRLLIAYCAWVIIYYCLDGYDGNFLISELLNPIYHYHLWFLPIIIGAYLLVPILRIIAVNRSMMHYSIIIWMCWMFIRQFPIAFLQQLFPLFSAEFFAYIGYFLMGYYLSQVSLSSIQKKVVFVSGILGAIITIVGTIVVSRYNGKNEFFFDISKPNVALMAIAVFLWIKEKCPNNEHRVLQFTEYVRKDLFGVYLIHVLWMNRLFEFAQTLCLGTISKLLMYPVISILVFLLSLYSTKLIRLIPGLRKIVE